MEINNENEKDILHFIFHTNILHIKSSRIPVMKNDVYITYQLMGRQHITQKYIEVYLIISLNKCESNKI